MIVAPRSETEHGVAALWFEMGVRPSSIDDAFDRIGGDPHRAGRLLSRIYERWAVRVTLEDFSAAPSIAGLAAIIDRKKAEARTSESDLLQEALADLESLGRRIGSFE